MDWRLVTEFFASVGYGLLSSFIPVFNSEVYIVAAQALGTTAEVTVAIGVAVGQTIGKAVRRRPAAGTLRLVPGGRVRGECAHPAAVLVRTKEWTWSRSRHGQSSSSGSPSTAGRRGWWPI
jgi:hypothetical protein